MLAIPVSRSSIPIDPGASAGRYRWVRWLCRLAIMLSLVVILLGGWTRLNDAGLACPDWPGCYGEMILPSSEAGQALAQARFEQLPLDLSRGWLEMGHRYLAGTLGLMVAALAVIGSRHRRQPGYPFRLSLLLLALVILQALFGMWTVTLKLLPQIVTLHLLGGLLTIALLLRLQQRLSGLSMITAGTGCHHQGSSGDQRHRRWVSIGLLLLLVQIGLGGWTSSNYAGWACSHWLECERPGSGRAVLPLDYVTAFTLPDVVAVTGQQGFQGGVLDRSARAAIQIVHRMMAVLVTVYLLLLAVLMGRAQRYRNTLVLLASLLAGQMLLGVLNVQLGLPLALAFAHHLGAVVLLVTMVRLYGLTEQPQTTKPLGMTNGER